MAGSGWVVTVTSSSGNSAPIRRSIRPEVVCAACSPIVREQQVALDEHLVPHPAVPDLVVAHDFSLGDRLRQARLERLGLLDRRVVHQALEAGAQELEGGPDDVQADGERDHRIEPSAAP